MRPRNDKGSSWAAQDEQGRELDKKIMRGSSWVALSYGGRSLLTMLSMLILVRLVEPAAFGLVAIAMTVILIATQLQGAGLSSAVIFHRDKVEERAATATVLLIASSLSLFVVALLIAPFLADFFRDDDLTNVFRALAAVLVLNALARVPGSLLEREVNFNLRARVELAAGVIQLGVSVGLAVAGWDVWALIAGQLAAASVSAVGNWLLVPWRPNLRLASWAEVRPLVRYGRSVSAANLLNIVTNSIDNMVVGRILGTTQLGFYAVTFRLSVYPTSIIGQIVGRVMFPVYSTLQGNLKEFRRSYVQTLQRVALLAFPVSVTLAVAAEPIVLALLGEDWRVVIEPLRILAIRALVKSIAAPAGEAFKGIGRPGINLWMAVLSISIVVPSLLVLVPRYGIEGAAFAMLAMAALSGGAAIAMALRVLELPLLNLLRALAPSAACSALLGVALAAIEIPAETLSPLLGLAVIVAGGAAVYLAATAVFARSVVTPMWLSLRGTR